MLWTIWIACSTPKLDTGQSETYPIVAYGGVDRYVELGHPITLDAGDVGPHLVEWNLGDGTILQGETIEHTYNEIGRKRVLLSVTAEDGTNEVDSINVVVHFPLPETKPTIAHQLVTDDEWLWTIFPEGNSLHRLSVTNPTEPPSSWNLCSNPTSIAKYNSQLAVTCSGDGVIALININDLEPVVELIELPVGYRPSSIIPPHNEEVGWWFTESALDQLGRVNPDKTIDYWSIGELQGLSRNSGAILLPHLR